MKKKLTTCILMLCCFLSVLNAAELPIVEINIEVLNCGKSAKLFYNSEKHPYIIPEDGKLTFLAYKGDIVKLKIRNIGYKALEYTVDTNGLTLRPGEAIPYKKYIKTDFKHASYYGLSSKRNLFFDENAKLPADFWIIGKTLDKNTGKAISGVSLGFVYAIDDSLVRLFKRNSNESGGFSLSYFRDSDIFLVAEKPGYYPTITKVGRDEFNSSIQLEKTSYLIRNIEMEKCEFDDRFISFIVCKQDKGKLDLVKDVNVLSLPTKEETYLGNNSVLCEFLNGRNTLDLGFLNPKFGFNRISVKTDYKNITCDLLYGKGDSEVPFSEYFSSLIFIPLNTVEGWHLSSITEMMSGNLNLSGTLSNSKSGFPLVNARVSLNDNEWVTFCDEKGKYLFEKIPGKNYSIRVTKNGFSDFTSDIYLLQNQVLDLSLAPIFHYKNSTVEGVLLSSENREPLAGYRLRLINTAQIAKTDSNGHFEFKNLAEGSYSICSYNSNYLGYNFYLHSDSTIQETLFLSKGIFISAGTYRPIQYNPPYLIKGILSGKLFDDRNLTGINNVDVLIEGTSFKASTNSAGEFVFPTLETGYYNLSCHSDKYKTLQIDSVYYTLDKPTHVNFKMEYIEPSETPEPSDSLSKIETEKTSEVVTTQDSYGEVISSVYNLNSRTGKISGQVLSTEENEPIIGANIIIEGTRRGAASGLQGDFIIFNVEPGHYTIKASAVGYIQAIIETDLNQFQSLECAFYLNPDGEYKRKKRGGWCPMD